MRREVIHGDVLERGGFDLFWEFIGVCGCDVVWEGLCSDASRELDNGL